MIIVQLIGGLGNQMFQYAAGRSLAHRLNTELKLDISKFTNYPLRQYSLSHFNIIENFADEKDLKHIKMPFSLLKNFLFDINCKLTGNIALFYFKEAHFNYDPNIFKLTGSVYLDGYWQSEKYFIGISDIIRKEFSVKNEPDGLNQENLAIINRTNSVSLHIRRQDYVSNPQTKEIYGVLGMEYYKKSLNIIEEMVKYPQIFVFSDDIPWVKANLEIDLPIHFIDHNGAEKDYEDLRLMSNCKHHIIANSSFSWWGAWLGKKPGQNVIAPGKWFASVHNSDMDNRIPKGWVVLNTQTMKSHTPLQSNGN